MNRKNSTAGDLYAIRKLAIDFQQRGIASGHPSGGVPEGLGRLPIEDDGWVDDARCLLIAAQAAEIHLGAIATLRDEDPIGQYQLPGFLREYGHLRGHPIPLPDPEVL